jgi:nitrite reductase (NO-forming)
MTAAARWWMLDVMSTTEIPHEPDSDSIAPHYVDEAELHELLVHDHEEREADRRALPGFLLAATVSGIVLAVIAIVVSVYAAAGRSDATDTAGETARAATAAAAPAPVDPATAPAPTIAQAKGVEFEAYKRPDPALPAVPAGAIKRFHITVDEHVAQVSAALAPTKVWTYGVNGTSYPGTGGSPPIVVDQGDKVQITLDNAGTDGMSVSMPHSIDFHSAEVAPNVDYTDVEPGRKKTFSFVAKHPGVYMYHCATQPILLHTGAGMTGMMVVRPAGLPAARELWITQQEFFIGKPGGGTSLAKVQASNPDVIAFNGFANQYKTHPIGVKRGERIRMYVLNAGVSTWSAFHVIGTVFDTTHVEGVAGRDSQTINLAPSQGGWVDFTLDKEGNYPFVTHAFADMVKGAAGLLHTSGAPLPKPGKAH